MTERLTIPDGIYLHLAESTYRAADALGSSDMKELAVSPARFWFRSRFNPLWKDSESTEAQKIGTATHMLVLEGEDKFFSNYAPAYLPGNIRAGKAEREAIEERGKTWIKSDAWQRILMTGTIIEKDPELHRAFTGGVASEVSIFWTANGIRKKARLDYLRMRSTVDLKTTTPAEGMSFEESCLKAIANYKYFVQALHYQEAREQMAPLIAENKIFVDTTQTEGLAIPHGMFPVVENLSRAAKSEFAFVFVFVSKGEVPEAWGCHLSSGNGILDHARVFIEKAEWNWANCMERFGLDAAWITPKPLAELSIDDLPAWTFR